MSCPFRAAPLPVGSSLPVRSLSLATESRAPAPFASLVLGAPPRARAPLFFLGVPGLGNEHWGHRDGTSHGSYACWVI